MQSSYYELLVLISVRAYRNVSCRRGPRARASPQVHEPSPQRGVTPPFQMVRLRVRRFGRRPRPITCWYQL
eukprot:1173839-Prorocentrum_minimum.AAC.1